MPNFIPDNKFLRYFLYVIFLVSFFFFEIKEFLKSFYKFLFVFKYISLKNFVYYKLGLNFELKNIDFNSYIKNNKKIWTSKINFKNDEKIIVTGFVHLPGDQIPNCIIGKYLELYHNTRLFGFLDKGDIFGELIFKSFGIKNILTLDKKNFFTRFSNFLHALLIVDKIKHVDDLINFKFKNINVGKSTYDHFLRFTNNATTEKVSFKIILFLSQCLYIINDLQRKFKNSKIKAIVETETQFIPSSLIFQFFLEKNVPIFSRENGPNDCSIRKYSSANETYTPRYEISKKLFKNILEIGNNKASDKGFEILEKRFQGKDRQIFYGRDKFKHIQLKEYDKEKISNLNNWDIKKPIVCVFGHCLVDNNFELGWRLYRDNLTWLRETLKIISKIDNVNWLIKPHPLEKTYEKIITNTEKEILNYNNSNIKLCPEDISPKSLTKICLAGITSTGSVAIEFTGFGLPVVTAGKTPFSELEIIDVPKSKQEYENLLKNINSIPKPSLKKIEMSKAYTYILSKLILTRLPLIPKFDINSKLDFSFFKNAEKLLERYDSKNDKFKDYFFYQLDNNERHTINHELLKNLN